MEVDEEVHLQWAAIERLPTFKRIRTSLFDINHGNEEGNGGIKSSEGKRVTDVTKLGSLERQLFIEKLIDNDNIRLLHKIRERIDRYFLFSGCNKLADIQSSFYKTLTQFF